MQPIKLSITGLNSYIETQTIDFAQLTQGGLFGIFGPTGSGKSTILDAITLAMYGMIPRETRSFINTNVNEASISYLFSLQQGSKRVRYQIDRSLKRRQNGGYTTAKALLRRYQNDEENVIAEGVRAVNTQIIAIIGLTADDFVRSVVLPQGKFDEFLRLSGLDRRNMLERLFSLEKYGKDLTEKIRLHLHKVNDELKAVQAALAQYQDVSPEQYQNLLCDLADMQKLYLEQKEIYNKKLKALEENKRIWEVQNALHEAERRQQELLDQQADIDKMQVEQDKILAAQLIKPHLDDFTKTKTAYHKQQEKLQEVDKRLQELSACYEEIKAVFGASAHKMSLIPQWLTEQSRLQQAVRWQEEWEVKQTESKVLLKALTDEENLLLSLQKRQEELAQVIKQKRQEIVKIEQQNQNLQVDPVYRRQLQEQVQVMKECQQRQAQLQELRTKEQQLARERAELQLNLEQVNRDIKIVEGNLQQGQATLQAWQKTLTQKRRAEQTHQFNLGDLRKQEALLDEARSRYQELQSQLQKAHSCLGQTTQEWEALKIAEQQALKQKDKLELQVKAVEKQELAVLLAKDLQEGEPCPVCGSCQHERKIVESDSSGKLERMRNKLTEQVKLWQELQQRVQAAEQVKLTWTINADNLTERLVQLQQSYTESTWREVKQSLQVKAEKLILLQKAVAKLEADSQAKQDELECYRRQIQTSLQTQSRLTEALRVNSLQTEQYKQEQREQLQMLQELEKQLQQKATVLSGEEAEKQLLELADMEQRFLRNEQRRKSLTANLQQALSAATEIAQKVTACQLSVQLHRQKLVFLEEHAQELRQQIEALCQAREPQQLLKNTTALIEDTRVQHTAVKERLEKVQREKDEFAATKLALDQHVAQLAAQVDIKEQDLQKIMTKHGFTSIESVRLWGDYSNQRLQEMQAEIKAFEQAKLLNQHQIVSLRAQCGTQTVAEQDLLKLRTEIASLESLIEIQGQQVGGLQQRIADIKQDLEVVKRLKKKLSQATTKLDLLQELNRLVKGNRFVEYVALRRLQYVAKEAAQRLRQMTHGRYVLELDDGGTFVVRDDFQGGARRPCDTLSGGEIFLTSLALALALSSQIQLKGHAPLEFFFLDEGFGSLDDKLLDTVVTALEHLRHDSLSVGVISHVQSLRERLPIKLIVTPATQEGEGSKVHIEVS